MYRVAKVIVEIRKAKDKQAKKDKKIDIFEDLEFFFPIRPFSIFFRYLIIILLILQKNFILTKIKFLFH
jgi:hypothetical protein